MQLPNGVRILAERVEGQKQAVYLAGLRCDDLKEGPRIHGLKHLIEHLAALGKDEKIDLRLESAGMVLEAETSRTNMVFTVVGPASQSTLALEALREAVTPRTWPESSIKREVQIIRHELALRSGTQRIATLIGNQIADGLDPSGSPAALAELQPEEVHLAAKELFSPTRLRVVVTGDFAPQVMAEQAATVFGSLPKGTGQWPAFDPGPKPNAPVTGSGLGVMTFGPGDRRTWARVGIAFALRERLQDGTVTFGQDWIVLASGSHKLLQRVGAIDSQVFLTAGAYARSWLRSQEQDPVQRARRWWDWLGADPRTDWQSWDDQVSQITAAEWQAAFDEWKAAPWRAGN